MRKRYGYSVESGFSYTFELVNEAASIVEVKGLIPGLLVIPSHVKKSGNAKEYPVELLTIEHSSSLGIKEVVIPNTVKAITSYSFEGCSELKRVVFAPGSTIRSIGFMGFRDCNSLQDIIFPDSLREIQDYAFSGCCNLQQVSLPFNVVRVDSFAFRDCSALQKFSMEADDVVIDEYAFSGCFNLREITIGATTGKQKRFRIVPAKAEYQKQDIRHLFFDADRLCEMDLPNGAHIVGGMSYAQTETGAVRTGSKQQESWYGQYKGITTSMNGSYASAVEELTEIIAACNQRERKEAQK